MNNFQEQNEILREVYPYLKDISLVTFTLVEKKLLPEFSGSVSTAAVGFTRSEEGTFLQFLVNPDFWSKLNILEKVFVVIHECLHVVFRHGSRGFKFLETQDLKSEKILNVAMDICINEIILNQFSNFLNLRSFPLLSTFICTIDSVFGDEADQILKHQIFDYYYHEILKRNLPEQKLLFSISFEDTEAEEAEVLEAIEEQESLTEESTAQDESKLGASSSGFSVSNDVKDMPGASHKIEKKETTLESCLKIVTAISSQKGLALDQKYKTNWYTTNRRLTALGNRGLFLPGKTPIKKEDAKYKVLVYCDFSGSCSGISSRFISLVAGLSDQKYEKDVIAFASMTSEVELKKDKTFKIKKNIGGGTNIVAVLKHFDSNGKQYDCIIVLTDGDYRNIRRETRNGNWNFFMFGRKYDESNHLKGAKMFKLR